MGWPSSTPIADHLVTLGDGRIVSYAEWGQPDGRPVVFVNGCPGSRLMCLDVEFLADGIQGSTLTILPGEGHLFPVTHWRQMLAALA